MSTLVLGGGISGLVAAWHLHRRGEAVEVWEAGPQVGGWVQTIDWKGPQGESGHAEKGPQGILLAQGSACDRLFREIGLKLHRPGHGERWLGRWGKLNAVPSKPPQLMFSNLMPLSTKLRMMWEPFVKVRDAEPEESLSDFVARRLGRGVADHLLPAMIAGILAAPPDILSVDALPKMRQWEASGSLFKGMSQGPRSEMVVPEGGMGALPKAIAARLPLVRTGLRAESLQKDLFGWVVRGGGEERRPQRILLALPAFEAAQLVGDLSPFSSKALASIPYTSVRLHNSRHTPLPALKDGFGFLIHPPEGKGVLGALVPSWMDPGGTPPGLMQLRSFVGGAYPVAPEVQQEGGVIAELKRWVPTLSDPVQTLELQADQAIPRAEMGHRRTVREALEGLPVGIDWVSNARFGPGVRDVVEGLESWAEHQSF
jgi:oxygen-dependent protoporphyrinogen oxidase